MSKWKIGFRLRSTDPKDAEIYRYIQEQESKGFSRSNIIRDLLFTGLLAKLGNKYNEWREG